MLDIISDTPTLQDYRLNFTINTDTGLPCNAATNMYIIGNLTLDPSQDNIIHTYSSQNTPLKFFTTSDGFVVERNDIQNRGFTVILNESQMYNLSMKGKKGLYINVVKHMDRLKG